MVVLLSADDVGVWWENASAQRPLPALGKCAVIAADVDFCSRNPGRKSRRVPERKISKALELIRVRIPEAREHWNAQMMKADGTVCSNDAPFILQRIQDLDNSLRNIYPDWLLDPLIEVKDLGWQSDAKFLYPKVARVWREAGHSVPRPHDTSPPCSVVTQALAYLGWGTKTVGSVAKMLRDAGMSDTERP